MESNDSFSPLLTHFSILFLLLAHPDTLRATCVSMGHKTTLASSRSFPQCFQPSRTTSKKWKEREIAGTSKHSKGAMNSQVDPCVQSSYSGTPGLPSSHSLVLPARPTCASKGSYKPCKALCFSKSASTK